MKLVSFREDTDKIIAEVKKFTVKQMYCTIYKNIYFTLKLGENQSHMSSQVMFQI